MKKLLILLASTLLTVATATASDYFDATGIPVARSTISSAEFRTEFTSIETDISDKLPPLTGNGNRWVRINAGGTALTSVTTATLTSALSLNVGSDVQAWDDDLDDIAALDKTNSSIMVGDGTDWVLEAPATARTSLGLAIGTNVQAYDADLTTYAGITPAANTQSLLGAADYAAMKALLNLEIATDVNAYDADLTTYAGITPSANVQSLMGAADYAAMKALLNLEIATDVNAYDADLTTWATVTPSANGQSLVAAADYAAMKALLNLEIGTDVQAWTAVLDANTASYTTALNTKLGNIETAADVTDATNVAAAGAPIISTGAGAPGSTPSTEGDVYVDLTNDYSYIAACTTSSACWKQASGLGGGDLLAANNLSDVAAAGTARTNLGLAIGTNVQAYDADLTTYAGITPAANVQSILGGANYAAIRALMDLEQGTDFYSVSGANAAFEGIDATILKDADIGGSVQAYDADLTTLAALDSSDSNIIVGSAGGFVVESGATALTSIGAQTADGDLTAIAALLKTNNNIMVANGSAWVLETPAQVRASLDLEAGTDLHAYDAGLAQIADLDDANGNFIVGNDAGTAWVVESGATALASIGGQAADADLTTWAGITPSANIQSLNAAATYAAARALLDLEVGTDFNAYDADLTTWAGVSSTANGRALVSSANYSSMRGLLSLEVGTDVQAEDAHLTDLAALAPAEGSGAFMVSSGVGAWGYETGATARSSMGVAIGSNVQAWTAVLDANTASYTTALNTKLGNIETAADVTDATNVAAAGAPIITTGAGAPGSTPSTEGDVYIDTTGDNSWISACTTSSACWKQASGAGGGDLLAANNLSDLTNAATAIGNLDSDLTTWAGITPSANIQSLNAAADYAAARALLDLESGTDFNAYDADLTTYAGITPSANVQSLLGAANYAAARGLLDLESGTDFNAYDADLTTYAGITPAANTQTFLGAANYGAMRTQLGLVVSTNVQAYDADLTTYGDITPAANTQSLLGAADYAAMKALLNLEISTDVQAYDADLTTLGALTDGDSTFIVGSAGGFVSEDAATARTSMGAQTLDADLTAIAGLAKTNNSFMVANGSAWALESASEARTSLGVDTNDTVAFGSVTLTTDLAVTHGGTGSSTAAAAASALGTGTEDSPQFTGVNVGHASDSTITRAAAGEIELEGRPMLVHDSGTYTGGRIIITDTAPTDVSGMDSGDMKFVY